MESVKVQMGQLVFSNSSERPASMRRTRAPLVAAVLATCGTGESVRIATGERTCREVVRAVGPSCYQAGKRRGLSIHTRYGDGCVYVWAEKPQS